MGNCFELRRESNFLRLLRGLRGGDRQCCQVLPQLRHRPNPVRRRCPCKLSDPDLGCLPSPLKRRRAGDGSCPACAGRSDRCCRRPAPRPAYQISCHGSPCPLFPRRAREGVGSGLAVANGGGPAAIGRLDLLRADRSGCPDPRLPAPRIPARRNPRRALLELPVPRGPLRYLVLVARRAGRALS